ncbi:MAG TPA: hypothetical protein DCM38_10720, partial [Gammaproteobacteria bacterium]|nr:hypothetical protein [Gammaproteobacteria bacterium]
MGQAAELAGVSKRTLMELLGNYGVSIFNYDTSDLVTEVTNARWQKREMEYDALGRITQITDADG